MTFSKVDIDITTDVDWDLKNRQSEYDLTLRALHYTQFAICKLQRDRDEQMHKEMSKQKNFY